MTRNLAKCLLLVTMVMAPIGCEQPAVDEADDDTTVIEERESVIEPDADADTDADPGVDVNVDGESGVDVGVGTDTAEPGAGVDVDADTDTTDQTK